MSGDAATNPLRFNGFDYDSAVKTYDMQARDYRPSVGRFLQSDRYESAQSDLSLVADPLTQNRYDFAGSDPVDSVEFDGHISPDAVDGQPWVPSTESGQTVKSQPKHTQKIRRQRAQQADDNAVPPGRQKHYDAEIDRAQAADAKASARARGAADKNILDKAFDAAVAPAKDYVSRQVNGVADAASGFYDDNLRPQGCQGVPLPGLSTKQCVGCIQFGTSPNDSGPKPLAQQASDAFLLASMAHGGGRSGLAAKELPEINWGAQEKHFLGHNSYIAGRSELTADPRKLIERAGSGDPLGSVPRGQPGFKERVDFGETIGTYVNPKTGVGMPSSRGMIVYGSRGAHIYPVRP
ncbi:MAG: hypothetical protein JWQ18_2817 [Conexibacter sp.]|nr:hypothetical protein [Conexibacter sp.]